MATRGQQGKAAPELALTASRGLVSWMARERVSLAFTTYQVGTMLMVGLQPDGALGVL